MGKLLTTISFIESAQIKHNHKFDYSEVLYINSRTPVKILCKAHGVFEQVPAKHLVGQGCPNCTHNTRKTKEQYLAIFNKLHANKYDYSQVSFDTAHSKVTIICPIHGEFLQTINSHKNGNGCHSCFNHNKKSSVDFIAEANKIHKGQYDYSLVEYETNKKYIIITCKVHGNFSQQPRAHLSGNGCPTCNESKGEKEIRNLLTKYKINFIPQHKFTDCKHIKPLPFDFYLPDYNMCIEYHGKQHYVPVKHFGGEDYFKMIQIRDNIKKEYCNQNGIQLKTIRYDDSIIPHICFTFLYPAILIS